MNQGRKIYRAMRIPVSELPLVDVSAWFFGDAAARTAVARQIVGACRDVGFMYVVGHGVPQHMIGAAFAAARSFFALPTHEKEKIHYRLGGFRRGYLPLLSESSDPAARGDLKEGFDVGLDPPGRAPYPGIEGDQIQNLWPDRPPEFQSVIDAYFSATRQFACELFSMLALGLDLDQDWFRDKIDKPIATMRLLHYPSQPAPTSDVLGIGEHCDYECFTLLAQDEVGGLQVRGQGGAWIAAPPIPGAFVVNVGEMLARWTNDELIATGHRVINLSGAERFSIPLFFATNPDVVIEPLMVGGSATRPPLHAPIEAGTYLAGRLGQIYGARKEPAPTLPA